MALRELIEQIDALKQQVDQLRPLSPEVEERIMQKFRLDWNFHSSNIEGNSLTYGETKTFLLHGLTASGKPLRDHLEIRGHNEAVRELQDIVREEKPLTEQVIRGLHQIILGSDSYPIPARTADDRETSRTVHPGRYKIESNHVRTVTGEMFYFASPEDTPAKMYELVEWYRSEESVSDVHPLLLASLFHYRFVRIHPFDDGNGRMARLLMNLIFMRHGYPPVIVPVEEKEEYFRALRQADGGEEEYFIEYIGKQLLRSLTIYLKGARGKEIEDADDLDRKIGLLKASLEKGKKEERVPVMKSEAQVREVVERSIIPLLEALLPKLSRFEELFLDKAYLLMGDAHSLPEFIEQIEATVALLVKHEGNRNLVFQWTQFRKHSFPSFDVRVSIGITWHKYFYKVGWPESQKGFQEIQKSYSQFLSGEEQARIVKGVVENVIEEIQQKVENSSEE